MKDEEFKKKALANKTKFDEIFKLKKEFFSEVSDLDIKTIYTQGFIDDVFLLSLIAFAEAYHQSRVKDIIYALNESQKDLIVTHGHIHAELNYGRTQWEGVDEIIYNRIQSNKELLKQ